MVERLLIRLHSDATAEWCVAGTGESGGARAGLPSPSAVAGRPVEVLVPADRVLRTRVEVPTRRRSRLLKALPFAVEDELAFDVESQHVVAGAQDEGGRVDVAVVSREVMRAWLERLHEAGLNPVAMVGEAGALALDDDVDGVVLIEDDRATVRTAGAAFACAPGNLSHYWSALAGPPETVRVHDLRSGAPEAPALPGSRVVDGHSAGEALALFAAEGADTGVNLLAGEFAPPQEQRASIRLWRAAAGLAAVWLLLLSAFVVVDYLRVRDRAETLQARIEHTFERALPDARLVNARVQVRQALAAAGRGDFSLLRLLSVSAAVLEGQPAIQLKGLAWRNKTLTLHLTAPSIAALDALRRAFDEGTALGVEVQSATATGDNVESRLSLSGVSG